MEKFSIDKVFFMLGEENLIGNISSKLIKESKLQKDSSIIVNEKYKVYKKSLRYMTFFQKGIVCACCGRKATHFRLESGGSNIKTNRRHFNLYDDDGVLFTKDHIYPKSKGGADKIENLQTMCVKCNVLKSDKVYREEG